MLYIKEWQIFPTSLKLHSVTSDGGGADTRGATS